MMSTENASMSTEKGGLRNVGAVGRQIAFAQFYASCSVWVSKDNSLQADPDPGLRHLQRYWDLGG